MREGTPHIARRAAAAVQRRCSGSGTARDGSASPWLAGPTCYISNSRKRRAHATVRQTEGGPGARTLMISSNVSSSISTVVTVSSTSPRIMFKCWS